jgi:hypothetical protein
MKAERPANRVSGFKCKPIGESLVGKSNAVIAFEQRAKRPADGLVLDHRQRDPRVLQRLQQAARTQREATVPDTHRVVVPEPLGADVIAVEERRIPCIGIAHVAIPLHQQHMRGRDVRQ